MGKIGLLILLGFNLVAVHAGADIFGKDDRINPRFGTVDHRLSKSVAVGILTSLVVNNKISGFDIWADKLSDFMCKDERFVNQPSLSYACTGFLVGPDLLMTAGHCATNYDEIFDVEDMYCDSYAWLFDFVQTTDVKVKTRRISKEKLYNCKKIIYAVADHDQPGRDFALIQLDRSVSGREHLTLSREEVKVGDGVRMIGAPMGLPLKVTGNAKVLKNADADPTILTDLDAFAGNSGSPVFNKKNEVIGILVSGTPNDSTYKDPKKSCERYNYCDQDGKNCKKDSDQLDEKGSDIEKLSKYRDLINQYIDSSKKRQVRTTI